MQPLLLVSRLLQGLMKPCARASPPSMVLMRPWRTVSLLVKGLMRLVTHVADTKIGGSGAPQSVSGGENRESAFYWGNKRSRQLPAMARQQLFKH